MAKEQTWTVVRFPSGTWSYGGLPSSPDYSKCEVYTMKAFTSKGAVRKAQAKRRRALKKKEAQDSLGPITPKLTRVQIEAEKGFHRIPITPCGANCGHRQWNGCHHDPSRTLRETLHPRITVCNHRNLKRGAK